MFEKFTSERLLQDLPRPLLNFIWYLWDAYYEPNVHEFQVSLCVGNNGNQQFVIHSTGDTVTQDFGCQIDAVIVIKNCDARCFMEYC